jgi:ABC-type antimicrobial peptide transport system permease subunit
MADSTKTIQQPAYGEQPAVKATTLVLGTLSVFVLIVCMNVTTLLLAVIGIYGFVAFAVSRRNKEVGIRFALGTSSRDVYQAILASNGLPVAVPASR